MEPHQLLTGKRILVVEDDYFIAQQLASDLSLAGVLVVGPAADVESALEQIPAASDIAGAILDIKLGKELVFLVADELERLAVPFVFVTGFEPDLIPARHSDKIVLRKPVEEQSAILALSQALYAKPVTEVYARHNHLLARLSDEDLAAVLPKLRAITLPRGAVMELQHQSVTRVYFPIDCVASMIVAGRDGNRIETGVIGREGVTGLGLLDGDDKTPYELITQIEGSALAMAADDFLSLLNELPDLRVLAARFSRSLGVQVSHTALANGRFGLQQRLARWLAMVHDRVPGGTVRLTHQYLSVMLGVRRSSVTDTLHILEGERLIRSNRGSIEIRDKRGLIAAAGESYGAPEAEYQRLMALPLADQAVRPSVN
ncbi:helix-turn-helix domain-containing protein [uncultured Agrobacterium sp.]|uniref:helix-turn-helix domain-containing protein n=1 Tax=uncultured Agrobacterium sp. TaxID=157277 RepID=UPI0025CBE44B|nr:helix-turn-helix domain-containing protein [uncultured Agrobacterium sp.]